MDLEARGGLGRTERVLGDWAHPMTRRTKNKLAYFFVVFRARNVLGFLRMWTTFGTIPS